MLGLVVTKAFKLDTSGRRIHSAADAGTVHVTVTCQHDNRVQNAAKTGNRFPSFKDMLTFQKSS